MRRLVDLYMRRLGDADTHICGVVLTAAPRAAKRDAVGDLKISLKLRLCHQLSRCHLQRRCNAKHGNHTRVLHTSFDAAHVRAVNRALVGELFLRNSANLSRVSNG